jgi:hypothetical protein
MPGGFPVTNQSSWYVCVIWNTRKRCEKSYHFWQTLKIKSNETSKKTSVMMGLAATGILFCSILSILTGTGGAVCKGATPLVEQ